MNSTPAFQVTPMFVLLLFPLVVVAIVLLVGGVVRGPAEGRGRRWLTVALLVPVVLVMLGVLFALLARPAVRVVERPGPPLQSYHVTTPAAGHAAPHIAYEHVVESYNTAPPPPPAPPSVVESHVESHGESQHAVAQADDHGAHAVVEVDGYVQHVPVEAEDQRHGVSALEPVRVEVATPAAGPAQWLKSLNQQDVAQEPHTSAETLHKFIVDRVATSVDKVSGEGGPRRVISDNVPRELAEWLTHRLSASGDKAGPGPERRPDGETRVVLRWQNRKDRQVPWWPRSLVRGTLEANISGPKGTAVVTARLDEKPWLYEPPAASNRAQYVVVMSDQPAATSGGALHSAKQSAVNTLYPRVRAELLGMSGGSRVPDATLRGQVQAAAFSGRGVVDECVVRVDRPYGPVWYAAQLREVSPQVLRSVAASSITESVERKQTFAGMIAGLGGMVLVLGLLYLALNALTRGYFRGRLRVATIVAAVVAGAAVLVLMA